MLLLPNQFRRGNWILSMLGLDGLEKWLQKLLVSSFTCKNHNRSMASEDIWLTCSKLSWNCLNSILLPEWNAANIWFSLPNWLGLCDWYRLRDHYLCCYKWWTLQPCGYDLLCYLARLSLEEGPILYLRADLWGLHSRVSHPSCENQKVRCQNADYYIGCYSLANTTHR